MRGSTTLFLMLVAGLPPDGSRARRSRLDVRRAHLLHASQVTLPLMLPMLLATWMYSFIGTLDDFETPLLIGLPAQIYLLPTVIYFTAYLSSAWGLAAAYATIFLLISVIMVVIYHRVVLRRTEPVRDRLREGLQAAADRARQNALARAGARRSSTSSWRCCCRC